MTTSIEMTKSFQERIFERIRDSVGELMSDDDLKKLVDAAVEKAFFEPRKTKDGFHEHIEEAWFVVEMRNLLKVQVDEALKAWCREHPDEISKAIDAAIAKGMFGLIEQHFERAMEKEFSNLSVALQNRMT